jgi:hypothetical protein
VIVQEARRSQRFSLEDVIAGIRRELIKEYLISPYAVALIAGGTLPKACPNVDVLDCGDGERAMIEIVQGPAAAPKVRT